MADRLVSQNKVLSSDDYLREPQSPISYPILLSLIKLTESLGQKTESQKIMEERMANREYVLGRWMETLEDPSSADPLPDYVAEEITKEPYLWMDQWTENLGDSSPLETPAAPEVKAERRRPSEAAEKRKRKSDGKIEGVAIKTEPLDDDKENFSENKPPADISPGSAARGRRYHQALRNAMEFLKDVKRELFFTNPEAYQQFLHIFDESRHKVADLSDRLRVVAEARDVIGHREDLMQRLVDLAMSDIPAHTSPQPLRPLVTASADNRGVIRRRSDSNVKTE